MLSTLSKTRPAWGTFFICIVALIITALVAKHDALLLVLFGVSLAAITAYFPWPVWSRWSVSVICVLLCFVPFFSRVPLGDNVASTYLLTSGLTIAGASFARTIWLLLVEHVTTLKEDL